MAKVSIIISACNEKWLKRTLQDVYEKAKGDFEVIVGINGPTNYQLPDLTLPNIRVHIEDKNIGLKPMLNKLARMATGKYILKIDAHVMLGEGFDVILQEGMQDDWVVSPRFYVLDAKKWEVQDNRFYDYFYLCCPFTDKRGLRFKAGGHWPERTAERLASHPDFDETPQIHGSCWFVNRDYFLNVLEGFPEDDPFGHAQEPIWLGLKAWLMGGKLMVNKKTWYAHLHQDSKDRGYPEDREHTEKTYNLTAAYWLTNTWPKQTLLFEWFVDKFMPMPGWPDNWEELLNDWRRQNG